MTESNPPAQPEKELRRRILLFLEEEDRRGVDHPHAIEIADALNETEKVILRHSRILECDGLVKLRWYIGGAALVKLLPKGFLEVEKIAQATPETDSPSSSEPSPEPQEFEHNADYSVVIWRGKEYFLTERQAECVRLLHKAHTDGAPWLRGQDILKIVAPSPKGIVSIRMSDIFRDSPAWNDGLVTTNKRSFYRLDI